MAMILMGKCNACGKLAKVENGGFTVEMEKADGVLGFKVLGGIHDGYEIHACGMQCVHGIFNSELAQFAEECRKKKVEEAAEAKYLDSESIANNK
jgi:hypothetical protein